MGKDPARKGGGKQQRRGASKVGLKRGSGGLASTLLKAIGASEERRKASEDAEDAEEIEGDVYEYEEGVPEEERGKNKRFDDVDRVEYELPSDFEDEEIDEDAAFGGDEEDAVLKKVAKKTIKEIDLNSDEDSDEDDNDEEAVEDEDDMEEDEEGQEESKSFDESDEEEEDDDDDEDDEGQHRRMIEAVTGKSASAIQDKQGRRGKGRVLSEAYPESEFNLNPSSGNVKGITVEDLMTPLQGTSGFGAIRKRMEQLQKRGAPVEAPLPKVIQDRINRKAAYEKTSDDITKWQPLVKSNREARTLNFNKAEPVPSMSTASLASSFKPTTDFEKEVEALLRESNVAEVQDAEAAEALELNKLTVEEVRERQERLAKMRNLLFRHEAKAKRLKKIKSKTYHRLLQKDQKSKAEGDAAVGGADPEAAKAAAIKREFSRARERMTLKHKNSSRWAKRILKRGLHAENDGTRDAITEQLRTHAALTRKIHSADLSDSDDASSDSEQETEDADAVSGLVLEKRVKSKVLAKAKVATLKALQDGDEVDLPTSGIFSLPFMARAIEKKKKAAQNEAIAILEQLENAEQDGNILGLDEDYSRSQIEQTEEATTSGRISFGKAKPAHVSNGRRNTSGNADDVTDEVSGEESEVEFTEKLFNNARVNSSKSSISGTMSFSKTDHSVQGDEGSVGPDHLRIESDDVGDISQHRRVSFLGVKTVPAKKVKVSMAGSKAKLSGNGILPEVPSQINGTGTSSNGVSTHDAVPQNTFSGRRVSFLGVKTVPAKKVKVSMAGSKAKLSGNGILPEVPSQINGTGKSSNGVSTHDAVPQNTLSGRRVSSLGVKTVPAKKVKVSMAGSKAKLSGNGILPEVPSQINGTGTSSNGVSTHDAVPQNTFSDDDSGDDDQQVLDASGSQQDLIRQAFAGDDVEAEFEKAKSQVLDEEVPVGEGPVQLPGWGQWTRVQRIRGQPAWLVKEQEQLKSKREQALGKRKDSHLKHVIISEKVDKKAAKYAAPSVPFPYTSREVFERSMRQPIGRDFNTDKAFRDMTRPAVIKSAGVIIHPITLDKSSVKRKELQTGALVTKKKRHR